MKKICFVVQRYGLDVNGGAELLCRELAEHLSAEFDVSVATTKARDYQTWKNEYPEDEEVIHGIYVRRFSTIREGDPESFAQETMNFANKILGIVEREKKWVLDQGPDCPELVRWLKNNKDNYDLFIFFTYLYYPAVFGIPEVKGKAVFVPTAHDEPFIHMNLMKPIFRNCCGLIYLTAAEKNYVNRLFHNETIPSIIGGCGIDIPEIISSKGTPQFDFSDYVVYIGRIDPSKGCGRLIQYFNEYKKRNSSDLQLVFIGRDFMKLSVSKDIHSLGFVSDEVKNNVLARARALILPSQFESLSMVVLEAMGLGVPVIVNGDCEVTKEHCIQSNAGLYYRNYFEFEGILNRLQRGPELWRELGENGRRYVESYYKWDKVVQNVTQFLNERIESNQ